ncbi:hypothetical protein JZX87_14080 [Agrobacterium sp. Ap1]|nr:hypothetical protein [Agrobacterium sp. Ap1]MBO0142291.1 hypothetical protein [Agrobacterium sp. Ap1]
MSTIFRVHFEDGTKMNIPAKDSVSATKHAKRADDGIITKAKLVREKERA